VGDVRQVPVGKYAKAALEKLGAWQAATPKLAMAAHTRVALTMVARGEAPLGIVYTTDANGARYCGDHRPRCVEDLDVLRPGQSAAAADSSSVKIIGTFTADSHPAIVYPVAGKHFSGRIQLPHYSAQVFDFKDGAGEGNRTLVISLEGCMI